MRQVLGPGALGRPRGIGWRGRWDGENRMGNTCKSMADSGQCMAKPLQYCKVISLQLVKIYEKKQNNKKIKTLLICTVNYLACISLGLSFPDRFRQNKNISSRNTVPNASAETSVGGLDIESTWGAG